MILGFIKVLMYGAGTVTKATFMGTVQLPFIPMVKIGVLYK